MFMNFHARVLPQALEIILEMQRKMSNEEITRRKISFPIYKMHKKKKISLDPSYFQTS
jgi:hypothetical protein